MRLGKVLIFVFAFILATFAGCRDVVDVGVNLKIEKRKLSNGLQVLMVEDHTFPVISYQTWFRVGSVDERPGMTGISHLFEHLMFKGTAKYGAKQFFTQLETKGAEVNAFTTRDYTAYYETFTPALLDKVMDLESDRMRGLSLSEELLESERSVVLEERRMRTDNSPEGKIDEALWELAYRRHSYRWPVIGYPQDLLSIGIEDLQNYYDTHYQPSNATLVIVGDFDPDETFDKIKKYYGPIPAKKRPERNPQAEPEQREERRLTIRDATASERFSHAYHVTSATDDDSYALDVLANILFQGSNSRAYQKLVEEKDLVLDVHGSAFTPTFPGLFVITCSMKGKHPAAEAEAALEALIKDVQEHGVTEAEVRVAVRQLTVQLVESIRTPQGLAQLLGNVQTVFGDPDKFQEDFAKYFKIKPDDVRRVAQKYMIPNNRSVVVLAPKGRSK